MYVFFTGGVSYCRAKYRSVDPFFTAFTVLGVLLISGKLSWLGTLLNFCYVWVVSKFSSTSFIFFSL